MKNKFLFLIIIACLLVNFSFAAASQGKVAYIVKSTLDFNGDETGIKNALINEGYNVSVFDDDDSINVVGYDLIIVGQDILDSRSIFDSKNKKTIFLSKSAAQRAGLSKASGFTADTGKVVITNITHQITDEFTLGERNIYTENGETGYLTGCKALNAESLIYKNYNYRSVLLILNKNAFLLDSGSCTKRNIPLNERNAFFGAYQASKWKSDAKTLFLNTVNWVLLGEDKDKDGYYSDDDCNDSNANIHPGATEIPYNHVNENCSDIMDLADVDKDGYCKLGYEIENATLQCNKETSSIGTDCNDNDASINPGAINSLKNCINEAPFLKSNLPNLTWNEDTNASLNLNLYFSDPDNDTLIYSVYDTSPDQNITVNIFNGIATFAVTENWNGNDWLIFKAEDSGGLYNISNNIILTVLAVNDAPVLQPIGDVYAVEGQIAEITAIATDPENDNLTYSINDTRFVKNASVFSWQTQIGNAGLYKVKVSVSDGNLSSNKDVNVNIIPKIVINEFVPNPLEGYDWVEVYNPSNKSVDLSTCILRDGTETNHLDLTGTISGKAFLAVDWDNKLNKESPDGDIIKLYCHDILIDEISYGKYDEGGVNNLDSIGDGKSAGRNPDGNDTDKKEDWQIFEHPTKNLPNNADMVLPIVTLISPANESLFNVRDVLFKFLTIDNTDELQCSLYLNNIVKSNRTAQNNTEEEFGVSNLADGNYLWNVKCSDGTNSVFANQSRSFNISAPDSPIINVILDKTVDEGILLQFTVSANDSDSDLSKLKFSIDNKPEGAEFTDNLNGSAIFSWTPSYNQSGIHYPIFIVKDETNLTSSQSMKITVRDVKAPPQFSDIDLCSNITPELEITIKEPDNGDKFKFGETIDAKVRIKNNANEDLDVDVTAYLYDTTEEKIIEDDKGSVDVDKGDSEDAELSIKVPDDIDEEDDYVIFVKAEGNGDFCNSKYVEIEIEREEDMVIIDSIKIIPQITYPGGDLDVSVKVKNIGSDEQNNVYIEITNTELGISEKSEEFDIEEYGEEDTVTKEFNIEIPEDADEGGYDLKATVYFSGENNSGTNGFDILKQAETSEGIGVLNLIKATTNGKEIILKIEPRGEVIEAEEKQAKLPETKLELGVWLNIILVIGIGLLIIVIAIVAARRK